MTLLLDGVVVRGKNLKITANLRIDTAELGGQTSATDTSHRGFKPKLLTVSLTIAYSDAQHLTSLMRLAEAVDAGGDLHVYRIVNDTAEAFGVRQVKFTDNLSAREDDSLHAWRVQFNLLEHLSNPERVESRQPDAEVSQQSSPGLTVGEEPELSSFEKLLKKIDDTLGSGA